MLNLTDAWTEDWKRQRKEGGRGEGRVKGERERRRGRGERRGVRVSKRREEKDRSTYINDVNSSRGDRREREFPTNGFYGGVSISISLKRVNSLLLSPREDPPYTHSLLLSFVLDSSLINLRPG
jgi:hypothetical protein